MTENSHTIDIVIYHNPACATSRNVLAMIRNAGLEPHVIEYLKTPPTRALLCQLIERAGLTARALLRQRDTPFTSLGLQDPALPDDMLIDTMLAYPLLINRPLVVSPLGVALCRPSERVLRLLPFAQRTVFHKEEGQRIAEDNAESHAGNPLEEQ